MKHLFVTAFSLFCLSVFAQDTTSVSQGTDSIFTIVDVMPEYPGGDGKLFKFLQKNIKYPVDAKNKKITGTVYTTFVVEKDGTLSNFRTLQSPDKLLSDEALRVLKLMPAWSPGKKNGKPVRIQYNIPINFT